MADVAVIAALLAFVAAMVGAQVRLARRTRSKLPALSQYGGPGYGPPGFKDQFGAVGREVELTFESPGPGLVQSGAVVVGVLVARQEGPFGKANQAEAAV